jgi:long-chain acyl-CoA synthetase
MGLYDFTIYDLIQRNAVAFANMPAWLEVDDGRAMTFAEVRREVDRLAAGLEHLGVAKGDRLGVLGKNSLEQFLLYGAAAALGAVVLPINWRLSAEEICFNLNDCTPERLFVDEEFQQTIEENRSRLPSVTEVFNLRADRGAFGRFSEIQRDAAAFKAAEVASSDGYVIIHTAAVAGRPRGALLSHNNLICADMHLIYLFGTTTEDVHLNMLPMFHIAGLVMMFSSFHAGALNLNLSKFDAAKVVSLIAEKKASLTFDFSPILGSILEEAEKTGKDISALRGVLGLEAPETIEKYQQATGGTFFAMYGQTETSCLATLGPYSDCPGSAGRPIELCDVRLFDDYDRPVETGQVGEICVRGPMVFSGYWNLPEDNARTFREGWHHTGDQGRFDADGFLFYAGRKAEKELIKPGGENVYPAEVEKVILQHPAVDQTVVFGVPDPKWKEGIKAVCSLKKGETLTAEALIDFVGARIARYKKPSYVAFVEKMPTGEDGAPDREEVKKRYGGEQK